MFCNSPGLLEEFRATEQDYSNTENVSTLASGDTQDSSGEPDLNEDAVELDNSIEDREESELIKKFFSENCCKLGSKQSPCYQQFSKEKLVSARQECLELNHDELDIAILAQIRAYRTVANEDEASARTQRQRVKYHFGGQVICRALFLFIHAISHKRLEQLMIHHSGCGLSPRQHKNKGRVASNATDERTIKEIKQFIENYAAIHAMPLPGRLPSYRDYRVMLLPSDITKAFVYRQFKAACEAKSVTPVCRRTFENLWHSLCPYIAVMKPASDLCSVCQENVNLLLRSANLPDAVKSVRLVNAEKHLQLAKCQRSDYNGQCKRAADSYDECAAVGKPPEYMHYSSDFAQQLHYPFNSQQPGELYFLTPRKCGLFGVSCEPRSYQVNYLIDEADDNGKGANTTISLVHHFLENHSLHEQNLALNADNYRAK